MRGWVRESVRVSISRGASRVPREFVAVWIRRRGRREAVVYASARVASLANRFVAGVAAAPHSSAARTDAGVLFAWGSNRHGILGVGDDLDRDEPARVALRLKTGGRGRGGGDGDGDGSPSPGGGSRAP